MSHEKMRPYFVAGTALEPSPIVKLHELLTNILCTEPHLSEVDQALLEGTATRIVDALAERLR